MSLLGYLQSRKLGSLVDELRVGGISYEKLAPIEEIAVELDANLTALDADVRLRLQLIGRIKDLMRSVFDINDETKRLLSPSILVYDSQIKRLKTSMGTSESTVNRFPRYFGHWSATSLLGVRCSGFNSKHPT